MNQETESSTTRQLLEITFPTISTVYIHVNVPALLYHLRPCRCLQVVQPRIPGLFIFNLCKISFHTLFWKSLCHD